MRAGSAAAIAAEAYAGVDENVTLNGSDYDWDASEALDIYCDEHAQELADDADLRALAIEALRERLDVAQ